MFYQIFLPPQAKRCVIITYKHGIYELPHELPNNLKLRILDLTPRHFRRWGGLCAHTRKKTEDLRKLGNIRKISELHRMISWCPVFLPK